LEYANIYRDISDPWYTGNFEKTEQDVLVGLKGFLYYLKENNAI
jgi:protein-tyrosine phosphatase